MPPRRQRAAAQAAAASLRTPTPLIAEPSDDEMIDVEAASPAKTGDSAAEMEATSPAMESEAASEPATPVPLEEAPPRKRRLGRPPKNRPPDWETPDRNDNSDTPKKRRGRPPGSGPGRWPKNRHLVPQITQLTLDKSGTTVDVVDDEAVLPDDPEGESKVDKNGVLQGGREYRCRTFTLLGKDDRLYMLSTEPARCIGFRDSYLFFQKHPVLYKLVIDDSIKHDMIDRDLMPHSYKGRTIGVVTARSVFREFGAQIIIGGKRVIDDYNVQKAKENGDVEGELAVPGDVLPRNGEDYNKNQYVAWHGASAVYHTGGPSIPMASTKVVDPKKRKVVITDENWMLEHARACSEYNTTLSDRRRAAWKGSYDIYTNTLQFPAHTQPTRARWEQLEPGKTKDTVVSEHQPDGKLTNGHNNAEDSEEKKSTFEVVQPVYSRNYAIVDTVMHTPPAGVLAAAARDSGTNPFGSTSIMDIDEELMALLPPDCLEALKKARGETQAYQSEYGTESTDGMRAKIRPGSFT